MADELQKYLNNRLKYHTASRIATQTGESLAQALNVDGHTVTMSKVWAAPANAFAYNENKANTDSFDATTDLVAVFKKPANGSSVTSGEIAGGKWWENTAYPAVRLYEGVKMTKVKGSDGGGKFQAFEVLAGPDGKSSGTLRLTDWIAPTAVADPTTGLPAAGYSGIPMYSGTVLKKSNTSKWAESVGSYEFAYIAGLLTFAPGYTPQDVYGADATKNITLTAFKYIGDYADKAIDKSFSDVDGRLDAVEAQLGIGGGAGGASGSITERVTEIEGAISGYTSVNTVKSAITSEATARAEADTALGERIDTLSGSAATYKLKKAASTTEGFAATYQLYETKNGVEAAVADSIINIPKDQFLKGAAYVPSTESLELTFELNVAGSNPVSNKVVIPVNEMVHEYAAGNGITVVDNDPTIGGQSSSISIKLDGTTESFLAVGANGLKLSGVQAAIDAKGNEVSTAATKGLTALSGRMDTAEAGLTALSGRMSTAETNIGTLSSDLSATSGKLTALEGAAVTGVTASNTVDGSVSANKITLNTKVSSRAGNAITVDGNNGLFAQKYREGANIAFGAADEDGVIPINGTFTFTLKPATADALGGVKSGGDITVDGSGSVTVNAASKVKNKLTAFGAEYDGSSPVTLSTTGNYLAVDNGTLSLNVNGEVTKDNTGLITGGKAYTALDAVLATVSESFEAGKVAVGASGNKLTASAYSIGNEWQAATSGAFGAASKLATESSVAGYINTGLDDLLTKIQAINAALD